jgi:hypothetical protein
MKIIIALILLLLIVFVVVDRNRIYVRDPLGSVTRAGIKEAGTQVFVNFAGDALIENDNAPMYIVLVQHTQIGEPSKLSCAHWLACLTDADIATLAPQVHVARPDSIANGEIDFHTADGVQAVVRMR